MFNSLHCVVNHRLGVRGRELKHLTTPRPVAWDMSDATKVVLGTAIVAGLFALLILLAMAL